MEEREYEMLVWGLQGSAQDQPEYFRIKVILISLFAYLVLFGMLVLMILGVYFMFVIARGNSSFLTKLFFVSSLLVSLPIVILTLRMFFARIPVPEGRELSEAEAPQLFRIIAELQERLLAAPIHHVLVTNEFNAAIAQCPTYGMFGGYRNYLILGLPFLYALSAEEIKAVIAHEYGHLSGSHGKMSHWIYRQRSTFGVLYEHARERRESSMVNSVFASLLDWFGPLYNAHTFVLSRQNEYEADAVASEIAGATVSASALIRIDLLSTWMSDSFWPKLYAQSEQHDTPTFMPYSAMRKLLLLTIDEWATKERLSEALKVESDVYDTHPCLNERVAAMDQRAVLPGIFKTSAADALLGNIALGIAREFDLKWWADEKDKWQKFHRRFNRAKVRIAELEQQPVAQLDVSKAQELALLLVEFRSVSAAKSVLEDLNGRTGERFPKPVYYYGRALLDEGDVKGLDYLEEAFKLSPSMGEDCARVGYQWLCAKQNEAAAENWLARLQAVHA
jgi:Zn-dependent protease with chaperone function